MTFLMYLAIYVVVGFIVFPKIARGRYDFRISPRSGYYGSNHQQQVYAMWEAAGLSLIWPIAMYLRYAKYAMFAAEIKEKKREAVQKQREIDLARARRIILEAKQEDEANWTSAITNLEKSADSTAKKLR